MKKRLLLSVILHACFFGAVSNLQAQENDNSVLKSKEFEEISFNQDADAGSTIHSNKISFSWHDPVTQLPKDFYNFGQRSLNVDNVPTIAGLTALTGLLIAVDHTTSNVFIRNSKKYPLLHEMNQSISFLGDGRFHFMMAGAFGAMGFILDDQRVLRTALQIVEAEIVTGLTVQVLKRITGRESPQSASRPRGVFRPFPNIHEYSENETKFYSFPSGHVSTSMAVLTVIADNFPEASWIKPVGYSAIGLVAISLVGRGWHWFSDYPLAIALGYTFGKVISNRNSPFDETEKSNSGLSIHPDFINGLGMALTYKF
jgi:membrane-associated phospholipid phosphatase